MKLRILTATVAIILISAHQVIAQTSSNKKNTETVTSAFQSVTFKNNDLKMAGNLYLPKGFDKSKKYAAIITVHPGGGVKEQTSGLYAQKMAELGYIALAFDASHQGASEGMPRLLEDPAKRVEDIRAAVDYLTTLTYVDAERIGLVGICAGGGYSISAAQTETRIKAVAVASPVNIGNLLQWDGKAPAPEGTLEAVAMQRTAEANGAEPIYVNYVPEVVDANTIPDMREAHDYYRTPRAQHPNSPNKFLFISLDKMMAFDAFNRIDPLLKQPILIVVGTNAGSRWQGESAFAKAHEPKQLVLIEDATHMDLYDVPKYVTQVIDNMTKFFGENL